MLFTLTFMAQIIIYIDRLIRSEYVQTDYARYALR